MEHSFLIERSLTNLSPDLHSKEIASFLATTWWLSSKEPEGCLVLTKNSAHNAGSLLGESAKTERKLMV